MTETIDVHPGALLCRPVEFLDRRTDPAWELHLTLAYIPSLLVGDGHMDEGFVPSHTKEELLEIVRSIDSYYINENRRYIKADVRGAAAFGPEKDIPVLTLKVGDVVNGLNVRLRTVFPRNGIGMSVDYSYNPHVTAPLEHVLNAPTEVLLRPLELWYRSDEPVVV